MPRKLTHDEYIAKAKAVHGDMFGYERAVYVHSNTDITITCKTHGDFQIRPAMHLRGRGCMHCGKIKARPFDTLDEFILKARKRHGHLYDYSNVVYSGADAPVKIRCLIHGSFDQVAGSHVAGAGCPKCAKEYVVSKIRGSTESFITKAQAKHGTKFDYSKVQYQTCDVLVTITCNIHGDFQRTPQAHLAGSGCPQCMKVLRAEKRAKKKIDEQ